MATLTIPIIATLSGTRSKIELQIPPIFSNALDAPVLKGFGFLGFVIIYWNGVSGIPTPFYRVYRNGINISNTSNHFYISTQSVKSVYQVSAYNIIGTSVLSNSIII